MIRLMSEALGIIDSEVVKGRNIQHIIALPTIGINEAVRELNEGAVLDTLLCHLSEQSPDLIDEIDPVDIAALEQVIMGFLGVTATD